VIAAPNFAAKEGQEMRSRALIAVVTAMLIAGLVGHLEAASFSFTASDVKTVMSAAGAPLSDATYQWGLWAVRAMPVVGGSGLYTIDSGATTQIGWGVSAPNGIFGAAPYTASNHVWFWDASGSEAGSTASNPLYMIMDQPEGAFESYTFDGDGAFVDSCPGTCLSSGYDDGFGGTNYVTAVGNSSLFTVNFTLGAGATWAGVWQFVVDGSKYTLGSEETPGVWVANFFGGYGGGGGLLDNMVEGYVASIGPPTTKDQCKNNGWRTFNYPRQFKNQGDCIQFVNTGK